eukprot:CAMPEP_0179918146 /NCGR_PEP_ID=MMETSP0983-20121128/3235_1 /TAXON_ID=483367 /ORGANISM="non described non described, Strain CCMP 2436" /LENGTH=176 /DNA_ID=CAMNT_0021820977 /DNA_START=837 /DNA_END=1368 /DNA_ORIENTATION=-
MHTHPRGQTGGKAKLCEHGVRRHAGQLRGGREQRGGHARIRLGAEYASNLIARLEYARCGCNHHAEPEGGDGAADRCGAVVGALVWVVLMNASIDSVSTRTSTCPSARADGSTTSFTSKKSDAFTAPSGWRASTQRLFVSSDGGASGHRRSAIRGWTAERVLRSGWAAHAIEQSDR